MCSCVGSSSDTHGEWTTGGINQGQTTWKTYGKMAAVRYPNKTFVFVDEHPDSINDGSFAVEMPNNANGTSWVDIPTKSHCNGCGFTFADGHSEIHKWRNPDVIPNVQYVTKDPNATIYKLRNEDVLWVARHTTARADGAPLPY